MAITHTPTENKESGMRTSDHFAVFSTYGAEQMPGLHSLDFAAARAVEVTGFAAKRAEAAESVEQTQMRLLARESCGRQVNRLIGELVEATMDEVPALAEKLRLAAEQALEMRADREMRDRYVAAKRGDQS